MFTPFKYRALVVILFSELSFFANCQNPQTDKDSEKYEDHDSLYIIGLKGFEKKNDTIKYNKLDISGYMQIQFEAYQQDLIDEPFGPSNSFFIRRARIKFKYLATRRINFVIQPEFSRGALSLKDAYTELSFSKENNIALIVGRFRRPNYESDISSNEKEILDRSKVLRDIFPDQRDVGLKLGYKGVNLPLSLQLAFMNGTLDANQTYDFDSRKDVMALATYSFPIPKAYLDIDLGMNIYTGSMRVKSTNYVSDYYGTIDSIAFGDYLKKRWFSGEIQVFMSLLGGLSIKGEYVRGMNAYDVDPSFPASMTNPYKVRYFSGYYLYLIKYVGNKHRFIARYDFFDPNLKATGDAAFDDVFYKTLGFAWEYYLNNNLSFALAYEFPKNEINSELKNDLNDNIFKAWIQVKF